MARRMYFPVTTGYGMESTKNITLQFQAAYDYEDQFEKQ